MGVRVPHKRPRFAFCVRSLRAQERGFPEVRALHFALVSLRAQERGFPKARAFFCVGAARISVIILVFTPFSPPPKSRIPPIFAVACQ